jgi:hypothetical protein
MLQQHIAGDNATVISILQSLWYNIKENFIQEEKYKKNNVKTLKMETRPLSPPAEFPPGMENQMMKLVNRGRNKPIL